MLNQGDMWAASKHMQRCAAVLYYSTDAVKRLILPSAGEDIE